MKRSKSCLFIFLAFVFGCEDTKEEKYYSYYGNGQVEWQGITKNGKKIGEWTLYDSLGDLGARHIYTNDTLVFRKLYVNGKLFSLQNMNGENVKDGISYYYNSEGSIIGKYYFENDIQSGPQITYYKNGQVKTKYYLEGEEMLDFKQFFENGALFAEAENANNGVVTFYDSLGNKTVEKLYEDFRFKDTVRIY